MTGVTLRSSLLPWSVYVFALLAVISRAWVAEDAYITFRAVENLFGGYGLVFNPGERTEVFTHPLWMLVLVTIKGVGLPLHFGSIITGILLSALTFYILIFRPFDQDQSSWIQVFPVAALVLAGISGFRDFATAGMEFTLVFFLFTLFSELILKRNHEGRPSAERDSFFSSGIFRKPFAAASILILLYLTRPELALLYVYYSFFILLYLIRNLTSEGSVRFRYKTVIRPALQWAAPFFLFAGIYHLFRFFYFQDIFPNTYYAKSGLSSYYIQGLKYLVYTILWSPGLWILIFFTALWSGISGLYLYTKKINIQSGGSIRLPFVPLYVTPSGKSEFLSLSRDLGAVLLLLVYVVRIGGDFMSFRFLLPEIVFFVLTAQRVLEQGFYFDREFTTRWKAAGAVMLMLLIFWPVPLHQGFVADERRIYTEHGSTNQWQRFFGEDFPWGRKAHQFRELQHCLGYSPFWISNSQAQARCMEGVGLGYFGVNAGPHVLIFDEQGLPNEEVSKAPVYTRFRPGHERYLTPSQVIEKGILFCSTGEPAYDSVMHTEYGVVISFDPELILTLPDANVRLQSLLELKKAGSETIPLLEKRWGITVESLIAVSQEVKADDRSDCWK